MKKYTKKDNRETCINCNKVMIAPFKGGGKMYCNRRCLDEHRRINGYWVKQYIRNHPERVTRLCVICKRNIKKVGRSTYINKYCSNRCMVLAQGLKHGQKTIMVKLTLDQYREYIKNA